MMVTLYIYLTYHFSYGLWEAAIKQNVAYHEI